MFYSIFLRSCGPKVQSFGATLFNMYVLTWSLLETFWVSYQEVAGVFKADVVDLTVENLKSFMSKGEHPTGSSVFCLDFSLFFFWSEPLLFDLQSSWLDCLFQTSTTFKAMDGEAAEAASGPAVSFVSNEKWSLTYQSEGTEASVELIWYFVHLCVSRLIS